MGMANGGADERRHDGRRKKKEEAHVPALSKVPRQAPGAAEERLESRGRNERPVALGIVGAVARSGGPEEQAGAGKQRPSRDGGSPGRRGVGNDRVCSCRSAPGSFWN
jgi:hypothetical protein